MSLENLRNEIDKIDEELTKLFCKRLEIVKKVGEYKKEHKLPVLNKAREHEVIEKNIGYVEEEEFISYVKKFLQSNADISKDLQNKKY